MDIMSPASLWKDYDRKQLALNVTRLGTRIENGYETEGMYFSALCTDDGVVRAYAKLYTPQFIQNPPIIIYFNDIEKSVDVHSTMMQALPDYAFLRIDYGGERTDGARHTIFPRSLSKLNFTKGANLTEFSKDIKRSPRYIWGVIAMRAVTLIEEELKKFNSIGMIGVGLGGCPTFMACSKELSIKAGMTIYSCGHVPEPSEKSVEYTYFKAALDCESYGPYISVPLLVQMTSNERDGSMDYMNEVFDAIQNDAARLSIVERSNRGISAKQRKNCRYWFDYHIKKQGDMPSSPKLRAISSEGRLYMEATVDKFAPVSSVELFVSAGVENSAYRNWSGRKLEMISENDYLVEVPVFDAKSPIYAFVNVKYEKGMSVSCSEIVVYPDKLNIRCEEIKPTRLIYDSDMLLDDWIVLNDMGTDDNDKLAMGTGPFDIMGVGSATGSISTFKISEKIYASFCDSALQILIYSPVLQDAVFSVAIKSEGGGFIEYSCSRKLSPSGNWQSLTLAATDFKSAGGALESFADVATFEVNCKNSGVLISSLLWV